MSKTFVMGDIHGGYKALLQCLERSGFNKQTDTLIQLGDVADGWSEVYQCVEELLTIPNLISIKGNHCSWFQEYLEFGIHPVSWLQGGEGTLRSYCEVLGKEYYESRRPRQGSVWKTNMLNTDVPETHIKFFKNQARYYKDDSNNVFVHGGFNRHNLLADQLPEDIFWWDRDLWMQALSFGTVTGMGQELKFKIKEPVNEIFIGHTATVNWTKNKFVRKPDGRELIVKAPIVTPMHAANIWNLDTGGGFKGKLTIMDVNTKEYWQSDNVDELYGYEEGRNKGD
jgi:serine/threonine protein phosphatase 1